MKLTTKRNRWYFWRELFSYMIPIILIVGTIDVFISFMKCPLHPEWSAPCSVNWIIGIMYWIPLILVIILAIISASKLRKVKKQIEKEFLEVTELGKEDLEKNVGKDGESEDKNKENFVDKVTIKKKSKPKKIIVEWDTTLKSKHKAKKSTKNF